MRSRSLSASLDPINDHEQVKQWEIDHRRVQETLSCELRASQRRLISEVIKTDAENDCRYQIERAGVRDQSPRQTGNDQQLREDQYQSKRGPFIIQRRQHEHSRSRVVFTIEPADGIEVWKLPEKKNGKENPCFAAETVCSRR